MSTLFGKLTTEGLEETEDRLGGFSVLDTDIYTGKIKHFYATKADSGAQAITVIADFNGKEYRETVYVTDKEGKNYFHPKDKDGKPDTSKRQALPGFTMIDDIALVTVGKGLAELDFEDKIVNIWDSEAKKELPKSVPVALELLGQEVSIAIVKEIVDKQKKEGNVYVNTGETREQNSMHKAFNTATKLTVVEAREAQKNNTEPKAVFWDAWLEKNKGQTRNKAKGGDQGGKAGRPSSPPQAGQQQQERKSLFGSKN